MSIKEIYEYILAAKQHIHSPKKARHPSIFIAGIHGGYSANGFN